MSKEKEKPGLHLNRPTAVSKRVQGQILQAHGVDELALAPAELRFPVTTAGARNTRARMRLVFAK